MHVLTLLPPDLLLLSALISTTLFSNPFLASDSDVGMHKINDLLECITIATVLRQD